MTQHLDPMTAVGRLTTAAATMDRLSDAIDAGRPWPVGPVAGEGPESDWGPPEVLAHVAEMLGYWLDQMELVIAGPMEPVPMGRTTGDPQRALAIERDRALSTSELLARIQGAIGRYAVRLPELSAGDWDRLGLHPRLGELTVGQMLERFAVGHMDEHAAQLQGVLGADAS